MATPGCVAAIPAKKIDRQAKGQRAANKQQDEGASRIKISLLTHGQSFEGIHSLGGG